MRASPTRRRAGVFNQQLSAGSVRDPHAHAGRSEFQLFSTGVHRRSPRTRGQEQFRDFPGSSQGRPHAGTTAGYSDLKSGNPAITESVFLAGQHQPSFRPMSAPFLAWSSSGTSSPSRGVEARPVRRFGLSETDRSVSALLVRVGSVGLFRHRLPIVRTRVRTGLLQRGYQWWLPGLVTTGEGCVTVREDRLKPQSIPHQRRHQTRTGSGRAHPAARIAGACRWA